MEWYLSLRGSSTYKAGLLGLTLLLGFDTYNWCFYRESVRSGKWLLGALRESLG